jgi:hypothetical protein
MFVASDVPVCINETAISNIYTGILGTLRINIKMAR